MASDHPNIKPLDEDRIAQTVVEYTGSRQGSVHYKGRVSKISYCFAAGNDSDRYKPVLDPDLDIFRGLARDFIVHDEWHYDPEGARRRREEKENWDQLLQGVAQVLRNDKLRAGKNHAARRGRTQGTGYGALITCLIDCQGLVQQFGSVSAAYNAIYDWLHGLPVSERPPGLPMTIPARNRFPNLRSEAKQQRGQCPWHRHPEPLGPVSTA